MKILENRGWVRLRDLPPGMIFATKNDGIAVKSQYKQADVGHSMCVLLESGEYASFEKGDNTLVKPLELKPIRIWPRVSFLFEWRDLWTGFYWDSDRRTLYWCPLPCCVVKIEFA